MHMYVPRLLSFFMKSAIPVVDYSTTDDVALTMECIHNMDGIFESCELITFIIVVVLVTQQHLGYNLYMTV
jgi:hypothetical protein